MGYRGDPLCAHRHRQEMELLVTKMLSVRKTDRQIDNWDYKKLKDHRK